MTPLLVAGSSVTGLVVGGILDPLGQRLAEHSLHRQRGDRGLPDQHDGADGTGEEHRHRDDGGPVGATVEGSAPVPVPPGPVPPGLVPPEPVPPVRLLPAGISPLRTLGAAVVTGGLLAAGAQHFGPHLVLVPYGAFFAVSVVVSTTDLSYGLIPRRLVYPALVSMAGLLAATAAADGDWHRLWGAGVGAAATFAVLFLIWWLAPGGMGFGDVRLSALTGLAAGWIGLYDVYVALVAAFVLGLTMGIVTTGVLGAGHRTRIPFAPALAVGAIVAVLGGAQIVQAVLHRTM